MWSLEPLEEYERRLKRFEKDYPRELVNMAANLERYLTALRAGTKPRNIRAGFIHDERKGVRAVDQKGKGKGLAQTRLYLFPDEEVCVVHLLMIGDKRTQEGRRRLLPQVRRAPPFPERSNRK